MGLHDEFKSDFDEILGEIGREVVWRNRTLRGLVGDFTAGLVFGVGGFTDDVRLTVKLRRLDLDPQLPQPGDLVRIGPETYRVLRVGNRPPHPLVILELGPKDA